MRPVSCAVSRVVGTVRRHPCIAGTVVTAVVVGAVVAGVLLSPRADGTLIGAPPATPVEQLTALVQEWLCRCGFAVDERTCKLYAEEFAYSVGISDARSGESGDVPRGWTSAQLWSQCPSASELVPRLTESNFRYAMNNAAHWAETHADRWAPISAGQTDAVMVQFLMLIAAVAIHAILPG